MKRKKLTKVEEYYVISNPDKLDVDKLAEIIGCAISSVKKLIAENTKDVVVEPVSEPVKVEQKDVAPVFTGPTVGDLMAKNKKYGVVIMTPAASERSDAAAEYHRGLQSSKYKEGDVLHIIKK